MLRKTKLVTIAFTIVTFFSFSQEKIAVFRNSMKENGTDIKDVIPIVDPESNEISLFIADAKNVYGYKLNEDYKVIDSLASDRKRRKFKVLVGNSISGNNHTIFLSNPTKSKFLLMNFSFDTKTTTTKEFTLEQDDEQILQTVSANNKFYLLSIRPYWGILCIYTFDNNEIKRNEVHLNNIPFLTEKGNKTNAVHLLRNYGVEVKKIDDELPNSLELVGDKTKMYIRDNTIVFSFDQNSSVTQILSISLDDFKIDVRDFKKPMEEFKIHQKNSNSFIQGKHIFLFTSNKSKLALNILDYNTNTLVKSFNIVKDQPIDFKNSPIILEGGSFSTYRELKKTKQFLRKINSGEVGIAVRKRGENYQITLGGYKEVASGGAMMMGGFGGLPVASFGSVSVFFNPAVFAYNSSTNTKSTRIECLLDKNFNHKEGEIAENVFEKIRENDQTVYDDVEKAQTVFKYKDFFILGRYYAKRKQYVFRKFTD
ncbi:hypothetical protein [uncultured Tenacibaculum sp.]|uniref:hypothetical protein n=1 Tax=uncultured Tenacibaculum sp. TaxID=174713 RepID=UPI0026142E2C|nr:hypothetical protein [uncultured Tenacibaculum sp.]